MTFSIQVFYHHFGFDCVAVLGHVYSVRTHSSSHHVHTPFNHAIPFLHPQNMTVCMAYGTMSSITVVQARPTMSCICTSIVLRVLHLSMDNLSMIWQLSALVTHTSFPVGGLLLRHVHTGDASTDVINFGTLGLWVSSLLILSSCTCVFVSCLWCVLFTLVWPRLDNELINPE